jgi:trans-aconitate methyltransferase
MNRMLEELARKPDSGLLATRGGGPGVMVQYWSSFEALASYASDRSGQHYPAWAAFNRTLAKAGDVGIWHETFLVPTSNIEAVYNHMPPTGLASYLPRVPATGHKKSARQRLAPRQAA